MSKYDNHSTSHLPLIESVIIISIFAVVSVFIMQLYVAADRLQGKSVNVSKATILAENTVEKIKAGEMKLDPLESLVSGAVSQGDVVIGRPNYVFYDKEWNVTASITADSPEALGDTATAGAAFFMTYVMNSAERDDSGCYATFTVTVSDIGVLNGGKGEELASITAGVYIPFD